MVTATLYVALVVFIVIVGIAYIYYAELPGEDTTWYKLGKAKVVVPIVLSVWLFLCSLVPPKQYFLYILATPYVVDGSKTLVESLQDENGKLFKLNKLIDGALDKAINKYENIEKGE